MYKYVLVLNTEYGYKHYPLHSRLPENVIAEQINELNQIAIYEGSSCFKYASVILETIWSGDVENYYLIYLLEDWFKEFSIEV